MKNWEGLGTPIMWMISGGREVDVGRDPQSNTWNNVHNWALYCQTRPQTFTRSRVLQTFTRLRVLRLTGKKIALRCIAPVLVVGYRPPPPHSPPIHLTSFTCSQAFPVFHALPLPCIILNANWRTKTGEAWKQGCQSPRSMHRLTVFCGETNSQLPQWSWQILCHASNSLCYFHQAMQREVLIAMYRTGSYKQPCMIYLCDSIYIELERMGNTSIVYCPRSGWVL